MALFKMADQYSTTDSSAELPASDSKKRPLDGAGEGRPSYKRSNLGGKNEWLNLPFDVWKFICQLLIVRFVMEYIRRHTKSIHSVASVSKFVLVSLLRT